LRKLILAGLLCGLAAFTLSGCFVMRTLTYTKDKVDAGDKTTALISVEGQTEGDEFPFFFLFSEGGSKVTNGGTLDTAGIADGPAALTRHDELIPAAEDTCPPPPSSKGPGTGAESIVATDSPFTVHNGNKLMDAKLPIKASTHSPGGDALGIYMGTWNDDGDGVVEDPGSSDDSYDCQPPYLSSILIRGGTPPPSH
jgi:hypothetical protein